MRPNSEYKIFDLQIPSAQSFDSIIFGTPKSEKIPSILLATSFSYSWDLSRMHIWWSDLSLKGCTSSLRQFFWEIDQITLHTFPKPCMIGVFPALDMPSSICFSFSRTELRRSCLSFTTTMPSSAPSKKTLNIPHKQRSIYEIDRFVYYHRYWPEK